MFVYLPPRHSSEEVLADLNSYPDRGELSKFFAGTGRAASEGTSPRTRTEMSAGNVAVLDGGSPDADP